MNRRPPRSTHCPTRRSSDLPRLVKVGVPLPSEVKVALCWTSHTPSVSFTAVLLLRSRNWPLVHATVPWLSTDESITSEVQTPAPLSTFPCSIRLLPHKPNIH